MNFAKNLENILRPLGVYDWENGVFHKAELAAEGTALDAVFQTLERLEQEMLLSTACGEGLEAVEALLPYRPVADTVESRRTALAALLRIGPNNFTLDAVNDNLAGCGINARAEETGTPGYVQICFPDVPGVPDGFDELRKIIEEIIPCHIGIEYTFWFVTWEMLEEKFPSWAALEAGGYDWESLEKLHR